MCRSHTYLLHQYLRRSCASCAPLLHRLRMTSVNFLPPLKRRCVECAQRDTATLSDSGYSCKQPLRRASFTALVPAAASSPSGGRPCPSHAAFPPFPC
jgi:hypothetical protein